MPLHDYLCLGCDAERKNIYTPMADIDDHVELCDCGEKMAFDYRKPGHKHLRQTHMKEFELKHMTRLEGKPVTIKTVADIRRLEKKYEDQQLCVEAFSYDAEDPDVPIVDKDEPRRMTEDEKRRFVEEYRARNQKDDRTARLDY